MTRKPPTTRRLPWALGAVLLATCAAVGGAQPIEVPARFQPPTSWADLAQAVEPAVVSIRAVIIETGSAPAASGETDPFEFFFGPRNDSGAPDADDAEGQPEAQRSDTGGSGFLISRDGLVVTNYHVIEGASRISVHVGASDYPAQVRGSDPATDLALLEIRAGVDLRYLELGDSDSLRVGDWVMVIGNPLNLDKTVTAGLVSAKGRSIGISDSPFENFIQTDAAINFGNSGGPLVDVRGRVVGIATAINYGAQNIGFAVPVSTLVGILPQLRDNGQVHRGYLGVKVANLTAPLAAAFGVPSTDGALVEDVPTETAAAAAGVAHGDVIVAVNGQKVAIARDLIEYVASQRPGTTVSLDIVRDGRAIQKSVTLGEHPAASTPAAAPETPPEADQGSRPLGIELADPDPPPGEGGPSGVLVTAVAPTSPLYEQGVRPGCVISEVNGRGLRNAEDLEEALARAKPGSYLRLYVLAAGANGAPSARPFFAVVEVPQD